MTTEERSGMRTIREISTTAEGLKILWLTENYPPQRGGMSVSCDRMVRNLRQAGAKIDVAHFSPRHLVWKNDKKMNGCQFSCPVRADVSHTLNRFWNLIENEVWVAEVVVWDVRVNQIRKS